MIEDLLATAEDLARLDRTMPRQVCLRRAVSNAYYALFHALALLNAEALVGRRSGHPDAFTRVYRALSHTQAKDVLRWQQVGSLDQGVSVFADAFVTLNELRQDADYNPLPFTASRELVLGYIAQARVAVSHLSRVPPDARLARATLLLFKPRR